MEGENIQARDEMALASYLSGIALANSGLGIVHGLASVIGGRGAAHGAICGRLLASALFVNLDVLNRQEGNCVRFREVDEWLAAGLGVPGENGNLALRRFVNTNGLLSLQDLGVQTTEFESISILGLGASSTKANPVQLDKTDVCRVLQLT
jgi:alcohol dehydrogenase class IV